MKAATWERYLKELFGADYQNQRINNIKALGNDAITQAAEQYQAINILSSLGEEMANSPFVMKPGDPDRGTVVIMDTRSGKTQEYTLPGLGKFGESNRFNTNKRVDKQSSIRDNLVGIDTGGGNYVVLRQAEATLLRTLNAFKREINKDNLHRDDGFKGVDEIFRQINKYGPKKAFLSDTAKTDLEKTKSHTGSIMNSALKSMQIDLSDIYHKILFNNNIKGTNLKAEQGTQMNMMMSLIASSKNIHNLKQKILNRNKTSYNAFDKNQLGKIFDDLVEVQKQLQLRIDSTFLPETGTQLLYAQLTKVKDLIPFDDLKFGRQQGTNRVSMNSNKAAEIFRSGVLGTKFAEDYLKGIHSAGGKIQKGKVLPGDAMLKGLNVSHKLLQKAIKNLAERGENVSNLYSYATQEGNLLISHAFNEVLKDATREDKIEISENQRKTLENQIKQKIKNEAAYLGADENSRQKMIDDAVYNYVLGDTHHREGIVNSFSGKVFKKETGSWVYNGLSKVNTNKVVSQQGGRYNTSAAKQNLFEEILHLMGRDPSTAGQYHFIRELDQKGGVREVSANLSKDLMTLLAGLNGKEIPENIANKYRDNHAFKTLFGNLKKNANGAYILQKPAAQMFKEAKQSGIIIDTLAMIDQLNHDITGEDLWYKIVKNGDNRELQYAAQGRTSYEDFAPADLYDYGHWQDRSGSASLYGLRYALKRQLALSTAGAPKDKEDLYKKAQENLIEMVAPQSRIDLYNKYKAEESAVRQAMIDQNILGANSFNDSLKKHKNGYFTSKDAIYLTLGQGKGYNIDVTGFKPNYSGEEGMTPESELAKQRILKQIKEKYPELDINKNNIRLMMGTPGGKKFDLRDQYGRGPGALDNFIISSSYLKMKDTGADNEYANIMSVIGDTSLSTEEKIARLGGDEEYTGLLLQALFASEKSVFENKGKIYGDTVGNYTKGAMMPNIHAMGTDYNSFLTKSASPFMKDFFKDFTTYGIGINTEDYLNILKSLNKGDLRKLYTKVSGNTNLSKIEHQKSGARLTGKKLIDKYANNILPYLTLGSKQWTEALESGRFKNTDDLLSFIIARAPYIKGLDARITNMAFADSNINKGSITVADALAKILKGDYDGDRMQLKAATYGSKRGLDSISKELLNKISARTKRIAEIEQKLNPDKFDSKPIFSDTSEKVALDQAFRNLIGYATHFSKGGVGVFSNHATDLRSDLDAKGYSELGLLDTFGKNNIGDYQNIWKTQIARAFWEQIEQDAISSKKLIEKYEKGTGLSAHETVHQVTDLVGRFFDNDNPMTMDELIERAGKLGAVGDEKDFIKGVPAHLIFGELIATADELFDGKKGIKIQGKDKQDLIKNKNDFVKAIIGRTYDELTDQIDKVSQGGEDTLTISKQEALNALEWSRSKTRRENLAAYVGRDATRKRFVIGEEAADRQKARGDVDKLYRNTAKRKYAASKLGEKINDDIPFDDGLLNLGLEYFEQQGHQAIHNTKLSESRVDSLQRGLTELDPMHNTKLIGKVMGSGRGFDETFINNLNKITKDPKRKRKKDLKKLLDVNTPEIVKAKLLGYGNNILGYRQAGKSAQETLGGTFFHKIQEVLTKSNNLWGDKYGSIHSYADFINLNTKISKRSKKAKEDRELYDKMASELMSDETNFKNVLGASIGKGKNSEALKDFWMSDTKKRADIMHNFLRSYAGPGAQFLTPELQFGKKLFDDTGKIRNIAMVADTSWLTPTGVDGKETLHIGDFKTSSRITAKHAAQLEMEKKIIGDILTETYENIKGKSDKKQLKVAGEIIAKSTSAYDSAGDPTKSHMFSDIAHRLTPKELVDLANRVVHESKDGKLKADIVTEVLNSDRLGGISVGKIDQGTEEIINKIIRGEHLSEGDIQSLSAINTEARLGRSNEDTKQRWSVGLINSQENAIQKDYIKYLKEELELKEQIKDLDESRKNKDLTQAEVKAIKAKTKALKEELATNKNQQNYLSSFLNLVDDEGNVIEGGDFLTKDAKKQLDSIKKQQKADRARNAKNKYSANWNNVYGRKYDLASLDHTLSNKDLSPEARKYYSLLRGQTLDSYNEALMQAQEASLPNALKDLSAADIKKLDEERKKTEELTNAKIELLNAQKKEQSMLGTLKTAWKNYLKHWSTIGIMYQIMGKVRKGIQQVIQAATQLDQCLTNLRIVTGESQDDARNLMISYSKLGKQLSATTSQVATAANDWLRQGYSIRETNDLITASMQLSKLGMIEAGQATQYLTGILKGFKMEASEATDIVDKLTKVDMSAAASAGDIAVALQQFSVSGQMAGLDLDQAVAMATTIIDVSQRDAASVGNALKTMIARFGNVKAGKFASDGTEETESLNDIETVLKKIGISMRDTNNEFRQFDDVLEDISAKWQTLDNVSQNAIATAIAGK